LLYTYKPFISIIDFLAKLYNGPAIIEGPTHLQEVGMPLRRGSPPGFIGSKGTWRFYQLEHGKMSKFLRDLGIKMDSGE